MSDRHLQDSTQFPPSQGLQEVGQVGKDVWGGTHVTLGQNMKDRFIIIKLQSLYTRLVIHRKVKCLTSGSPMAESMPAQTNTKPGLNWNKEHWFNSVIIWDWNVKRLIIRHVLWVLQMQENASPHMRQAGEHGRRRKGNHCSPSPPVTSQEIKWELKA